MITNKTRKKIAQLSAEPITGWIKEQATSDIQQMLCVPRCGEVCDAPCPMALRLLDGLTCLSWLSYARTN